MAVRVIQVRLRGFLLIVMCHVLHLLSRVHHYKRHSRDAHNKTVWREGGRDGGREGGEGGGEGGGRESTGVDLSCTYRNLI